MKSDQVYQYDVKSKTVKKVDQTGFQYINFDYNTNTGTQWKENEGIILGRVKGTISVILIALDLIPVLYELWLTIRRLWSKEAKTIQAAIAAARKMQAS